MTKCATEFYSGKAILDDSEDLLGRDKFSHLLADSFLNWKQEESLVVALYGEWGSGKTSIKNMAVKRLYSKVKETKVKEPLVFEFCPWEWAAQDKVSEAFYNELSESIGRSDASDSARKLSVVYKKIGMNFATGAAVFSEINSILPTLSVVIVLLGLAGTITEFVGKYEYFSKFFFLVVFFLGAISAWGNKIFSALATKNEYLEKVFKNSRKSIRSQLIDLLEKRESPLIIVFDDLDRLNRQQLEMLFQLIKSNSEFPNVMFFLLFQRDLVESKLTHGNQDGSEFLEKIIQVSFDVPKINKYEIHKLFNEWIALYLDENNLAARDAFEVRYGAIYDGIKYYINSLRDVYRLMSSLSFYYSAHTHAGLLEVDHIDVIGIECLRLFEPEVYKAISEQKGILTGREDPKEFVSDLLESIKLKSSDGTIKLLSRLFPTIQDQLGGTIHSSSEWGKKWAQFKLVCSSRYFDRYFQLSINKGEISIYEFQTLLKSFGNVDELVQLLKNFENDGKLVSALQRLDDCSDEIDDSKVDSFINASVRVADELSSHIGDFSFGDTCTVLRRIIRYVLHDFDLEERSNRLLNILINNNGLALASTFIIAERNAEDYPDIPKNFTEGDYDKLKEYFLDKVTKNSINSPSKIINNPEFGSILHNWTMLGDVEVVSTWVQSQIQDWNNCMKFLKKCTRVYYTSSCDFKGIRHELRLDEIKKYVTVVSVEEALNRVDVNGLNDDEKHLIELFRYTVTNKNSDV